MIVQHTHQWVPWNTRRLTVCDETGCSAAIRWDGPDPGPIIDWREEDRTSGKVVASGYGRAFRCRARVTTVLDGEESEPRNCGREAAVGLVTEPGADLILLPLCAHHVDEPHPTEGRWTTVSLAYGASGGDLR